jgi:hypothetical protein
MTFTPDDGSADRRVGIVYDIPEGGGVAMSMYNTDDEHRFGLCAQLLQRWPCSKKWPLYLSAPRTPS